MHLSTKMLQNIQKKEGNTNHIWIYDRSGSMYYDLPNLGRDLKRLSKMLKLGDTLTLSWFSSEGGQFRTILKGHKITDTKDFEQIEKIIDANIRAIGCTCFSEVLHDTVTTITELQKSNPENSFAFVFFTDGHPVVRDLHKEENAIFAALKQLQTLIGEALFIGYNQHYNRTFLSKMAGEVGGSLIHAEKMVDVSENIEILIKHGKAAKKIIVDIPDSEDVLLVFGKSTGKVVVYPFDPSSQKVCVSDSEQEITIVSKRNITDSKDSIDQMYSTAYALASQNKMDEALEWLGKTGDKYLIDKLYNAFTTVEIGEALNEIHAAVFNKDARFKEGTKKNYVPKPDAFCLLEALEILIEDKFSYFYPSSKDFKYERTGVAAKVKPDFPNFERTKDVKSPFANLVWNSERLNLSVLTKIEGQISIPSDCTCGLQAFVDCYQWRNYTLIKDGMLNVKKIPVSVGKTAFLALQAGGLIPRTTKWKSDEIYLLDLKRIPIMNRKIADDYLSAQIIADKVMEENAYMAIIKVLKHYLSTFEKTVQSTKFTDQFTDEQIEYLIKLGMRADGSYSPPTDKAEVEDYYEANCFQLKAAGWSSLPSVTQVLERKANNKALNPPAQAMNVSLEEFDKQPVEVITHAIEDVKKKLDDARRYIQRAKFAVVLGKRQFKEFTEVKDVQSLYSTDGTKIDFCFGKKKIAY